MEVFTLEEVAEKLKVTIYAVRKYIKDGKLKTVTNMGSVRVTSEELNRFLRG